MRRLVILFTLLCFTGGFSPVVAAKDKRPKEKSAKATHVVQVHLVRAKYGDTLTSLGMPQGVQTITVEKAVSLGTEFNESKTDGEDTIEMKGQLNKNDDASVRLQLNVNHRQKNSSSGIGMGSRITKLGHKQVINGRFYRHQDGDDPRTFSAKLLVYSVEKATNSDSELKEQKRRLKNFVLKELRQRAQSYKSQQVAAEEAGSAMLKLAKEYVEKHKKPKVARAILNSIRRSFRDTDAALGAQELLREITD